MNWKSIPKIDGHIHIIPDEVHNANEDSNDVWSKAKAESYLRIMKENNIEKAAIMPVNDPYLMSMSFSLVAVHKNLLKIKNDNPDRFYVFADIDSRCTSLNNLVEIRIAIEKYHFSGIKIHPCNTGIPVDDEYNMPIFEYAMKNNIPVVIHSYPANTDDPDSSSRICKIISQFPGLRLMIAHLGAFQYNLLLGRDLYVDLSAILPYFVEKMGITKTNELLRRFPVDRIVFATDWPDSRTVESDKIYDRYFAILDKMDFTAKEAEKIAKYNFISFISMKN